MKRKKQTPQEQPVEPEAFEGSPANPPYGQRGDFRKLTVTLPPDIYRLLVEESAHRKIRGEPNRLLVSIVREAVIEYLTNKQRAGSSGAS